MNGGAATPRQRTIHCYSRVSTAAQATDGQSLEAQARALRAYVELHRLADDGVAVGSGGEPASENSTGGTAVVDYVDRGVSGSKPLGERPEGARLLEALAPGDIIVATKLDRMFRSALDALSALERFREQGVALHLIDLGGDVAGNGIARFFFTVLSAFAEMERERIRGRVQDMVDDRRSRGMWLGGARAPFGYAVGPEGQLVEDQREQDSLHVLRTLRARGASYRAISRTMKQRGTPLSPEGVRRALARERGEAMSENRGG